MMAGLRVDKTLKKSLLEILVLVSEVAHAWKKRNAGQWFQQR